MSVSATQTTARAPDRVSIAPLVELCKAGRLFDVQRWIAEGKPVNMPPHHKGTRPLAPLDYAIDRGFHSLLQVLLEAGALQEPEGHCSPMHRALAARRFDMVQLLVEYGFDPKSIDMTDVFETWDAGMMEYFIDRGADIHTGHPFASALCNRIRTALTVYKKRRERDESLQEQADIALRHHCFEGNEKWVSLMLWAGADPWKGGPSSPGSDSDEDGLSAIEYAIIGNHYGLLYLKPIRTTLTGENALKILGDLNRGRGLDLLERLLDEGLDPNDHDGGCSAITRCIDRLGDCWYAGGSSIWWDRGDRSDKRDTDNSRQIMKAIHLLARHGGRWQPRDKKEIEAARRSFLQLTPDYVVEFVWIMSKYGGCGLDPIRELLRTASIKAHVAAHRGRLDQILGSWPDLAKNKEKITENQGDAGKLPTVAS